MKQWAYLYPNGYERISAAEAVRRRNNFGGKTRGVVYFSRHASGDRVRMRVVDPKVHDTPPHFRYLKKSDSEDRAGSEESIHHSLFKQALASIGTIRIKLEHNYHLLDISDAIAEVRLPVGDAVVRPDVRWRFTSDTLLDKKWDSTVYVEVCHKHPVPGPKLQALIAASVPVIEVDIPEYVLFKGDDNASEDWQNNYLAFAKRQLEDPSHFLPGIVLSDPSSRGYSKIWREWNADKQALKSVQQELAELRSKHAERQRQVQEWVLDMKALVPAAPFILSPITAPSFDLTPVDNPSGPANARATEITAPPSTRSGHPWSLPVGMMLGGLVFLSISLIYDHWQASAAEETSAPSIQTSSAAAALTEAPLSDPRRVAPLPHKAPHPKKKAKKKPVAQSSGDVAGPSTAEEAADSAPAQWFQVVPQSSEQPQPYTAPAQ